MVPDTVLKKHLFVFNDHDNGGEALTLQTTFIANGDPGEVYTNQVLQLQSYGNAAAFNLFGAALTPEMLRKLAAELEAAQAEAENLAKG
jgi:hypothetical protein